MRERDRCERERQRERERDRQRERDRERERERCVREREREIPSFTELSDSEIMPFLLGEDDNTAALAAKYVLTIHNVRCST